ETQATAGVRPSREDLVRWVVEEDRLADPETAELRAEGGLRPEVILAPRYGDESVVGDVVRGVRVALSVGSCRGQVDALVLEFVLPRHDAHDLVTGLRIDGDLQNAVRR